MLMWCGHMICSSHNVDDSICLADDACTAINLCLGTTNSMKANTLKGRRTVNNVQETISTAAVAVMTFMLVLAFMQA